MDGRTDGWMAVVSSVSQSLLRPSSSSSSPSLPDRTKAPNNTGGRPRPRPRPLDSSKKFQNWPPPVVSTKLACPLTLCLIIGLYNTRLCEGIRSELPLRKSKWYILDGRCKLTAATRTPAAAPSASCAVVWRRIITAAVAMIARAKKEMTSSSRKKLRQMDVSFVRSQNNLVSV